MRNHSFPPINCLHIACIGSFKIIEAMVPSRSFSPRPNLAPLDVLNNPRNGVFLYNTDLTVLNKFICQIIRIILLIMGIPKTVVH